MKIWIDILTPKQLLFFKPIIQKLRKNHTVLCTSRKYREVSKLAKIHQINIDYVGNHGGENKSKKLESSINRMKSLYPKIQKFMPELTISFCSPEASRIAFGLGIKHIGFCDSPHASAVMKLTIPLINKILIPWIIPKKEFTKYGIEEKNIIQYKAIDASVTIKNKVSSTKKLPIKKNKKNILIRIEEEQAAYVINKKKKIIPIINEIVKELKNENIIILTRYQNQKEKFKKLYGDSSKIISMSYDGRDLLRNSDIFIGSGGTMTAEAALMGIPTISYNAVPNIIEKYLVRKKLVVRETNPKRIIKIVKNFFNQPKKNFELHAKQNLKSMEDPYKKLLPILKN